MLLIPALHIVGEGGLGGAGGLGLVGGHGVDAVHVAEHGLTVHHIVHAGLLGVLDDDLVGLAQQWA